MSPPPTYKIAFILPVVIGVVGFFMGRQFSSAPVIPAAMATADNSGSTEVKQVKPELDGKYAAWAAKVEQAEAGELKEIYDNVQVTFPEAGSSVLAAARAFVLECWAGKNPLSLIKAAFAEEDRLEAEEVGTALARWNARDALQLIVQTMTTESEEDVEADGEDWHELLRSTVSAWASLRPEEFMKMIGPLQPWYIQHGIIIALVSLSKTNAAEAASKFDRWIRSGQMTAADEIGQEWIGEIARHYYQQNGAAAREWIASISISDLRRLAAQTYCVCLAKQEGDALITEFTRADSIALALPDLSLLLESNACRPNASLIAGLKLVQAIANRIGSSQLVAHPSPSHSTLAQASPSQSTMMGSGRGGSSMPFTKITVKSKDDGRSGWAREFVTNYVMRHGSDPGFWAKFSNEVSALPAEWSAELSNLVQKAFDIAEPHWEADPLAALKATAGLPQACQAPAVSRLLTGLQTVDPAAVTRYLATLPSEQLASLPPVWQLMLALGSAAPATPFKNVEELIGQMSGPSPVIEKFVVERGTGEVAYVRKLMHTRGEASAANWAAALPPARAPEAIGAAVHLWAMLDDKAAAAWVMALPIGPLRAAGSKAMATSLAPYDREASRAWTAKAKESP